MERDIMQKNLKKSIILIFSFIILSSFVSAGIWDTYSLSYLKTLFIQKGEESELATNSSDYWDDLDTPDDIGSIINLRITEFLNFTYFCDRFGVGCLDGTGDPWYLSGTDFEIDQDLQVNNTVIENDLTVQGEVDSNLNPETTLTYSLGTGVLRWLNLFVQNINAEEIETYNLVALNNVTADYFIGNGSQLTDITYSETDPYSIHIDKINNTQFYYEDNLNLNTTWITNFFNTIYASITDVQGWISSNSTADRAYTDTVNASMAEYVLYVNSTNTGGSAEGDNLGNHNATQNISINSNWIWLSGNETTAGSNYMYSENGIIFEGVIVT